MHLNQGITVVLVALVMLASTTKLGASRVAGVALFKARRFTLCPKTLFLLDAKRHPNPLLEVATRHWSMNCVLTTLTAIRGKVIGPSGCHGVHPVLPAKAIRSSNHVALTAALLQVSPSPPPQQLMSPMEEMVLPSLNFPDPSGPFGKLGP
jgi:hypothetical protein